MGSLSTVRGQDDNEADDDADDEDLALLGGLFRG